MNKDRELRGILINLVNQTCCHMNEQDKFVDQAISLIKALYKPLGKGELLEIIDTVAKERGNRLKKGKKPKNRIGIDIAQEIINARDKKGKN